MWRVPARARAVVAIASLAIGCATAQAPDRAKVAATIGDRTRIDAMGLPGDHRVWTAPPGASLTDGLSIDEAVSIALWNNADFQLTLASLGLARADLIDAGLLKNPVFSLLFPWGPKQLEFTLTWSIDALWQRPKRIEDARLNAEATAEQLASHGLRLVADVRLAFFEVLVSERRLLLAAEQAAVAADAARMSQGRFRAGDISEFEARLTDADAVRLEAMRLTRVTARDLSVVRLRALLGLMPDAPAFTLTEPVPISADTCDAGPELLKSALAARPEVRAAELQIDAAGARVGLEKARVVAITASLDANARGTEGFEMGPGIAVELPIFSQNQGGKARAAAQLEQAARRYVSVRSAIAAEVASATIALAEARAAARLLGDDVMTSLAAARRQSESLFKAGEISLLDMLQTRQRLIDIDTTRADAAFGVNRAIVQLEQAIGRTCTPR